MNREFPELTSFGTLLNFAMALENRAEAQYREALQTSPSTPAAEILVKGQRAHFKRRSRLDNLRRERLNEVVLQPLAGLDRADYLPPTALGPPNVGELAALERILARFYRDANVRASSVLGGLQRTFERFARESDELAGSLVGPGA